MRLSRHAVSSQRGAASTARRTGFDGGILADVLSPTGLRATVTAAGLAARHVCQRGTRSPTDNVRDLSRANVRSHGPHTHANT